MSKGAREHSLTTWIQSSWSSDPRVWGKAVSQAFRQVVSPATAPSLASLHECWLGSTWRDYVISKGYGLKNSCILTYPFRKTAFFPNFFWLFRPSRSKPWSLCFIPFKKNTVLSSPLLLNSHITFPLLAQKGTVAWSRPTRYAYVARKKKQFFEIHISPF